MERMRDYERYASECLELYAQASDVEAKFKLLAMAQAWTSLANMARKNALTDIVYETPPARARTGESGKRPVEH